MADNVLQDRWARRAAGLLATVADPQMRVDLREQFEERAGICEQDGGMTRAAAERVAYEEIAAQVNRVRRDG